MDPCTGSSGTEDHITLHPIWLGDEHYGRKKTVMSWDWDKLKKQQKVRGGGGGQPPQVDEIVEKLKNVK